MFEKPVCEGDLATLECPPTPLGKVDFLRLSPVSVFREALEKAPPDPIRRLRRRGSAPASPIQHNTLAATREP